MKTIELTDGGILLIDDVFLPHDLADRDFVDLRDYCAWEQKPSMFGHMQPRLTASYGDEGVTYRYSGALNGKVKLEASVSSQDGKVRLWKDRKEDAPLDAESPYWFEIRLVDDGKPTKAIPLKDSYFEMQLPKVFFEGNLKTITMNWIDFYRN